MAQGRKLGGKNREPISIEELARINQESMEIVRVVAEEATAKLVPLGFTGFSAKMLQADVNLRLEEAGLPLLNLPKVKIFLGTLGYEAQETAYSPMVGTKYTSWTLVGDK